MIGDAFDQRLGVQHLVLAVLAKGDIRHQMGGNSRDADGTHLRVAGDLAARVDLGAKVRPVVGAIIASIRRPYRPAGAEAGDR